MKTELTSIVKSIYESFARAEPNKDFLQQLVWKEMVGGPYGGEFKGLDAIIKNVFSRIDNDWEYFKHIPEEFIESENKVIVIGNYRGKSKVTKKELDARVIHTWSFKDNIPVIFEQFTDTALIASILNK